MVVRGGKTDIAGPFEGEAALIGLARGLGECGLPEDQAAEEDAQAMKDDDQAAEHA
ncbi:MAG TPA: hypothetical protein VL978_15240 [Puia sp.]|nr:hypothetical protein [Puia sp.]